MSVKRNKYFEEDKKLKSYKRELEKYYWKYKQSNPFYELVPLERPIFAGWDISIVLTEEAKRRRDSAQLQEVLDVLELSKFRFTKNVLFIKDIRKNKYNVESIVKSRHNHSWEVDLHLKRHINKTIYFNLTEEIKKFFCPDSFYKYSSTNNMYYKADLFPFNQHCRVKVTKSYYNYQRVPKTDLISEHTKLENKIERNDLWDKVYGGGRYRDSFQRGNKLRAKKYCHLAKEEHNMGEEGLNDDNEPVLAKLSGLYDKKEFGWD